MATFPGGTGSVTYVNGVFYNNGVAIDPYEFTKTQFNSLIASDYAGITVRITNVHQTSAGVGGVLLTGGSSWTLESPQIYYDTFANGVAAFPAATYPGLRMTCGDVNGGKLVLVSNGTRYKPQNTQGYLFSEVNGSLASPSKTLPGTSGAPQLFTLDSPNLPANLVTTGDLLIVNFQAKRHGVGNMTFVVCLGTGAGLTDASLWTNALSTTDNGIISGTIRATVTSNTNFTTNSANSLQQTGSATTALSDQSTNLSFTSAQTFKAGLSVKATSTDTFDLLSLSCLWVSS